MHALWSAFGRDPKGRGTLVVQYDTPKGMTPAEVGVLFDERADMRDISASIVDLAVRGYLVIQETEKKVLLFKTKDYQLQLVKRDYGKDAALKPFEKRLLDGLFGGYGDAVLVSQIKAKQTFGVVDLPDISKKLYQGVVADGYFLSNPATVKAAWMGGGAVALAVFWLTLKAVLEPSGTQLLMLFVSGALSAVILAAYAMQMSVKTPKGVEAYEHAVGFREYLERAETYRLQWQEKEGIFETFLPYAMAFGVAQKWAKAFEGMQLRQPDWYRGHAWQNGVFNAALFNGVINDMNGAVMSAMRSAPSQSSSGSGFSGGHSGGGFGGGGGGSW
jgi:uncharacterized membrane protein